MDQVKRFLPNIAEIKMTTTNQSLISWGIYQVKNGGGGKLGIIALSSFSPTNDDSGDKTVKIFRGLLVKELAGTDAIVIDIRNNGGGLITIADALPQFFVVKPLFDTINGRIAINDLNSQLVFGSSIGSSE